MLIRLFKKKTLGGKKIKGTHFIGVRVGCLKINRNSDKKNIFSKNEHFYLFNKTYAVSPNKIKHSYKYFSVLFPKTLYFIKKYHILLTIFGTENGRPYLIDFE